MRPLLESTIADLRYALRTLRNSVPLTISAIVTLALGIGANAAIFQLLDTVRLRSLPVRQPSELTLIAIHGGNRGFGITDGEDLLTYPLWEELRNHQQSFSGVFAWTSDRLAFSDATEARQILTLSVTGDFFGTLGLEPAAGHFFPTNTNPTSCSASEVVLTDAFWRDKFGADPSIIGRRITLNGKPFFVTGVLRPPFSGLEIGQPVSMIIPMCELRGESLRRDNFWLWVMGRLKRGETFAQATDQLGALSPSLTEATVPSSYSTQSLNLYRRLRLEARPDANGVSWLRHQYNSSLVLLLAISGLVLLIACANLANLMLARGSARRQEFAVRVALGASRLRLIRQSLGESLLLVAAGATLGIALSRALSQAIVSFFADEAILDLVIDWRLVAFTGVSAGLACVIFGVLPAVQSSRSEPGSTMRAGGRTLTGRFSIQRILVVVQISVSLVLVAGALLFVRSFRNLVSLDPGFREQGVLLAEIDLSRLKLAPEAVKPYQRQVLELIHSTSEIESAASTSNFLLGGGSWTLGINAGDFRGSSKFTWVSPGHFALLDTPIIAGRDFNDRDTQQSPKVAIVNQRFIEQFFSGKNPLGKTFRTITEPNYPEAEYQIIGVIKNTRYAIKRDPMPSIAYAPASQFPEHDARMNVYVRSSAPLSRVTAAVKSRLHQLNPDITGDFREMAVVASRSIARERLMAALSGFFGALAALIATIGLYGLIAYIAVRRRNEIGIRMALGASRTCVVRLVMAEAAALVGAGLIVGIAGGLTLARIAASLLFGLVWRDPATFAGAAVLLSLVALLGSFVPALRASRIDPLRALRYE